MRPRSRSQKENGAFAVVPGSHLRKAHPPMPGAVGQAVFCSWNVNTADPLVVAHAERTIADKLRDLKIMR